MTNPQVQSDPIYSLPFLYAYGMTISNDATTPNTKLNVSAGQVRDSNDNIDLPLGSSNPPLNGVAISTPLVIDCTVNGINGLDTGALAASKLYAVWVIGDSSYKNPVGCIVTLASNALPLTPLGYDSLRLIGYAATDSSVHFLPMYVVGNGGARQVIYDAPQATAITAGNATSYTAVDLSTLVPSVANTPVSIASSLTPSAAGRGVFLQGAGSTGDQVINLGQVTSVVLDNVDTVLAQLASSLAKINYKVSNGSDAVSLKVAGYTYYI